MLRVKRGYQTSEFLNTSLRFRACNAFGSTSWQLPTPKILTIGNVDGL